MKLTYRPEIDGLRAVAVVAVILYHAQITILGYQPFKGGFIGVDIFFVISGYLITSIILKELVTTGSFSFKHFYERRIRRILPALLFVMLVSLPFAWMYLLPGSFIDFSKSILYSLGFSSNFYFHYSGQVYGAESGLLKPFLHTWSLSVEEQFYILFPIILLVTFKYFRKYLIHILILGFVISLGLAEWTSINYPSTSFYFLHTRMWELLAGSILAYFEIKLGHRSKSKTLNFILPSIGLLLIGHSILFFNDEIFHPSFYSLSPIIGVCLIIWFSSKNELITKILSTKLFVGIGLISYSLYLWHYPIFAFSRINESFNKENNFFLLVVLTLLMSLVSYFLVEKQFRKNKSRIIIYTIFFSYLLIFVINLIFVLNKGYKSRFPLILEKQLERPWEKLQNINGEFCHWKGCSFNETSNKKIYLIGDSHLATLLFDLRNRLNEYNFVKIKSGCIYFPGFNYIELESNQIVCSNTHYSETKNILANSNNSIIIIGGFWQSRLGNYNPKKNGIALNLTRKYEKVDGEKYDTIQESFLNEIEELQKNNKIILIYPIPVAGANVYQKILNEYRNSFFVKKEKMIFSSSYKDFKLNNISSFKMLDSVRGENIYRVYPHELFCSEVSLECITHDFKDIYYYDEHHLSLKGAELVNDLIMKEIEKIELKSN